MPQFRIVTQYKEVTDYFPYDDHKEGKGPIIEPIYFAAEHMRKEDFFKRALNVNPALEICKVQVLNKNKDWVFDA